MIEKIEQFLTNNFQKNVDIEIDDKIIKKGKFILYKLACETNYYHIELSIERPTNHDKIDIFKLPVPFGIETYPEEGLIYFDYRLKTLFKDDKLKAKYDHWFNTNKPVETLKFYDKILILQFKN